MSPFRIHAHRYLLWIPVQTTCFNVHFYYVGKCRSLSQTFHAWVAHLSFSYFQQEHTWFIYLFILICCYTALYGQVLQNCSESTSNIGTSGPNKGVLVMRQSLGSAAWNAWQLLHSLGSHNHENICERREGIGVIIADVTDTETCLCIIEFAVGFSSAVSSGSSFRKDDFESGPKPSYYFSFSQNFPKRSSQHGPETLIRRRTEQIDLQLWSFIPKDSASYVSRQS